MNLEQKRDNTNAVMGAKEPPCSTTHGLHPSPSQEVDEDGAVTPLFQPLSLRTRRGGRLV